jgi:putative transcriptional regulator
MAIVKVTKEMAEAALRDIDWAVSDSVTDEEIERQVAGNPDAAPLLTDEELDRGEFGSRVRQLRQKLNLSQPAFAERFRIPVASLRDWEHGRRMPDAATRAYLIVIEREPEAVRRALAEGRAA